MSPVWIMNEGFAGSAPILPIASSSVPITLGLAGLLKPIGGQMAVFLLTQIQRCRTRAPAAILREAAEEAERLDSKT
jgi:hypothetical protein